MSDSRNAMLAAGGTAGVIALLSGVIRLALIFGNVPYSVNGFFPSPVTIPYGARSASSWMIFVVSLVLVVAVVGALTWLARSSLGDGPGRAGLFLATWCSCMLGGVLAALTSGMAMLGQYADMPGDPLSLMILQFATGGLQWGLTAGWLVAIVTVALGLRGSHQQPPMTASYPTVPPYPGQGDQDQR